MDGYEQAQAFHEVFHPVENEVPSALSYQEVNDRAGFMVEELVEWLSATSKENKEDFSKSITKLHQAIDQAYEKEKKKEVKETSVLVGQTDALLDMLYFTYGSFALMAVNPKPLQKIVHNANMGKIFPDGNVHYHPETGKVLKPDNWEQDFAPEMKLASELKKQSQRKNTMKK